MKKKYRLVVGFSLVINIIGLFMIKLQQDCINKWKRQAEKNTGQFMLLDQWTRIKQEGKNLEIYFIKNNYRRIAIYGIGYIGKRLIKELKNSEIEIIYGIDQNADSLYSDIRMFKMDEELPDVDAVVVTLTTEFDEVCEALSWKVGCPVISIDDIVNEI